MSSSEEDERKETVNRPSNVGTGSDASEVMLHQSSDGSVQAVVAELAPKVERESVVKHKSTNTSALVGMVVGIAVLAMGLALVIKETPFLPYPWSVIATVVVGVALIGVGASLVSNRTMSK